MKRSTIEGYLREGKVIVSYQPEPALYIVPDQGRNDTYYLATVVEQNPFASLNPLTLAQAMQFIGSRGRDWQLQGLSMVDIADALLHGHTLESADGWRAGWDGEMYYLDHATRSVVRSAILKYVVEQMVKADKVWEYV